MIWFYAEDPIHYSEKSLSQLKRKYNLDKVIFHPEYSDLKKNMGNKNVAFLAPYLASEFDIKMKNSNFFSTIELPNKYGVLTSSQKKLGIDESSIMEEKFGISFYESTENFSMMGGGTLLKEYTDRVITMETLGIKIKGVMLVGMPGTGKSFWVKCFAGETKRVLVALNLATLMFLPNPIFALNAIFTTLSKQKMRFIIWIDEIEKQLTEDDKSKQILGAFLTILNDLNTSTSNYSVDAIFVATANNIQAISKNNPEFLRKGRFDELFFLNYPSPINARSIFEIYRNKTNKLVQNEMFYKILFNEINTKIGIVKTEDSLSSNTTKNIVMLLDDVVPYAKEIYEQMSEEIHQVAYPSSIIEDGRLITIKELGIEEEQKEEDSFSMSPDKQFYIFSRFRDEYKKAYEHTEEHKNSHALFSERLNCDFDIEKMYHQPEIIWGERKINTKLYVYTPAEIENYVKEWFVHKALFGEISTTLHETIVTRLKPLQVSMRGGLDGLAAQKDNFIEVT